MIDRVLEHLRVLVAADTSDPAETLTRTHPAIAYSVQVLEAFGCEVAVEDLGGGCVDVLAVRGRPACAHVLFNVHLDTVRADPRWRRDPFALSVEGDRVYGLGACDIKGAAASLFAAMEATEEPVAVLLTTDEEGGKGACVGHFLDTRGFDPGVVVVAEPTRCAPVLQHRGFASFEVTFGGCARHTSRADAMRTSATHAAIRWAARALDIADQSLADSRFNIGMIRGGSASNVVASDAAMRFGFRPAPEPDALTRASAAVDLVKSILPDDTEAAWTDRFMAPPLLAGTAAVAAIDHWGLERGPDVDFWTEAALFAAAGLPAVVIGPGDIARAHTADEYVETDHLTRCAEVYRGIIRSGAGPSSPDPDRTEGVACAP